MSLEEGNFVDIYYMNCFSDDIFFFFDLLLMPRLWFRLSSNSRSIIISCVTLGDLFNLCVLQFPHV